MRGGRMTENSWEYSVTSSDYNPLEDGCLCDFCGEFFWLDEYRQHLLDGCPCAEIYTIAINNVVYVDIDLQRWP